MRKNQQIKKSRKYLKYLNEYGMTQRQRLHRIILRMMDFDKDQPSLDLITSKTEMIDMLHTETGKEIKDSNLFLMSTLEELSKETGLHTHFGYGDLIYVTRSEE